MGGKVEEERAAHNGPAKNKRTSVGGATARLVKQFAIKFKSARDLESRAAREGQAPLLGGAGRQASTKHSRPVSSDVSGDARFRRAASIHRLRRFCAPPPVCVCNCGSRPRLDIARHILASSRRVLCTLVKQRMRNRSKIRHVSESIERTLRATTTGRARE